LQPIQAEGIREKLATCWLLKQNLAQEVSVDIYRPVERWQFLSVLHFTKRTADGYRQEVIHTLIMVGYLTQYRI
jgi:hypothetical protein